MIEFIKKTEKTKKQPFKQKLLLCPSLTGQHLSIPMT